ncbi:MAG TPA: VCBS repeat-containing protein, partial [Verrucomicrobiae bacterium]|nr:VCBS repeat-containing protein [Verrucomicrobiae bacterium]
MNKVAFSFAALLLGSSISPAKDYSLHTFKKTQLTDKFWSEGATFGDLNRDGKPDIVSGPYWYQGPAFTNRHQYYPATATFVRKNPKGSDQAIKGFEGALGV